MAEDQAAARALVRTHLMELAEANANILAVNTALDKAASSALQSHLLVTTGAKPGEQTEQARKMREHHGHRRVVATDEPGRASTS